MSEFAVSASYPQLANPVPVELQGNIRALVLNLLQPVCDATGWRDEITSGYRSAILNRMVGGSKTSQHMKGEAADNKFYFYRNGIRVDVEPYLVAKKIIEMGLKFDQMIVYTSFVHLSYSKYNRNQFLYNRFYNGKRL